MEDLDMENLYGPDVLKAVKEMATDGVIMLVFEVDEDGEIDGEPCRDWLAPAFVEAGHGVNLSHPLIFPPGCARLAIAPYECI